MKINLAFGDQYAASEEWGNDYIGPSSEWDESKHPRDNRGRFTKAFSDYMAANPDKNPDQSIPATVSDVIHSVFGTNSAHAGLAREIDSYLQRTWTEFHEQIIKLGKGPENREQRTEIVRQAFDKALNALGNVYDDYKEYLEQNRITDGRNLMFLPKQLLQKELDYEFGRSARPPEGYVVPDDYLAIRKELRKFLPVVTPKLLEAVNDWVELMWQHDKPMPASHLKDIVPLAERGGEFLTFQKLKNDIQSVLNSQNSAVAGAPNFRNMLQAAVEDSININLNNHRDGRIQDASQIMIPEIEDYEEIKPDGYWVGESAVQTIANKIASGVYSRYFMDRNSKSGFKERPLPPPGVLRFKSLEQLEGNPDNQIMYQSDSSRGKLPDVVDTGMDLYALKQSANGEPFLMPLETLSQMSFETIRDLIGEDKRTGSIVSPGMENFLERQGIDFMQVRRKVEAHYESPETGFQDELSRQLFGNPNTIKVTRNGASTDVKLQELFGRVLTDKEIIRLFGAPDGTEIGISGSGKTLEVQILSRDFMGIEGFRCYQQRRIYRDLNNDLACENMVFELEHPLIEARNNLAYWKRQERMDAELKSPPRMGVNPATGKDYKLADLVNKAQTKLDDLTKQFKTEGTTIPAGIGVRMFLRQVEGLIERGVSEIFTDAAGLPTKEHYNGYNTWAKFGYDGLHNMPEKYGYQSPTVQGVLSERPADGVLKGRMGVEVWDLIGSNFRGKFDLKQGSMSRRILSEYVKKLHSKGKVPLEGNVELKDYHKFAALLLAEMEAAAGGSSSGDNKMDECLDEQTEEILAEIWKNIGKGKLPEDELDKQLQKAGYREHN